MKKFVTILLILCFVFGTVNIGHSETNFVDLLTPEQHKSLQLDVDVFGMCVSEETYPYVIKNYTTEYAVGQAFEKCVHEGRSIVTRMKEYGADDELTLSFLKQLFEQMVGFIDTARNTLAEQSETKPMKAPKKSF